MQYINFYESPLGELLLCCDEQGLIGIWFSDSRFAAKGLIAEYKDGQRPVLDMTKKWLDVYFSGKEPAFTPRLHFTGSEFGKTVCRIMCGIPYGKTMSYGAIAAIIARRRGCGRMSAQAVGGAVGHNPVSIIVPCHRVVGSNGNLTGYGGGIERKIRLLTLEKNDMTGFFLPKKGRCKAGIKKETAID